MMITHAEYQLNNNYYIAIFGKNREQGECVFGQCGGGDVKFCSLLFHRRKLTEHVSNGNPEARSASTLCGNTELEAEIAK